MPYSRWFNLLFRTVLKLFSIAVKCPKVISNVSLSVRAAQPTKQRPTTRTGVCQPRSHKHLSCLNTYRHPSSASWSSRRTDQTECPHRSNDLWCDSESLWDSKAGAHPLYLDPATPVFSATSPTLVSGSPVWPRHLRASGLASDGWVIAIITQEPLQGAATWQRPPMFNRIFGCFIDLNSAPGAGKRGPGW